MNNRFTAIYALIIIGIVLISSLYIIGAFLNISSEYHHIPTSTPIARSPAIILSPLNGRINSLDGDQMTNNLWAKMKDFNSSDPSIKSYIKWIRWVMLTPGTALATKPYHIQQCLYYTSGYWHNPTYKKSPEPPTLNQTVRLGVIRLPYGIGVIVTAYRYGDHINIVLHGTIVNSTAWENTIAMILTYWYSQLEGANEIARDLALNYRPTSKWVMWRMAFTSYNTSIETKGDRLQIHNIYVFLEMPAYFKNTNYTTSNYFYHIEEVYWDLMEPIFALAYHFIIPETITPQEYYSRNYRVDNTVLNTVHPQFLPNEIVRANTTYGGPASAPQYTPFTINYAGEGVCNHFSRASSLFATNALASYSAYMVINDLDHSISLLIFPSSKIKSNNHLNLVNAKVDVDQDGVNDSAVVIDDVIDLQAAGIDWDNTTETDIEPPLQYTDPYSDPLNGWMLYFYMGIPQSLTSLPRILQAPWLPLFKPLIKQRMTIALNNFTIIWSNGNYIAWTSNPSEYVEALFTNKPDHYRKPDIQSPEFWVKIFREILDKKMSSEDFQPPSSITALNKTIRSIPLIYESKPSDTSIIYRKYFNYTIAKNIISHSNYWWNKGLTTYYKMRQTLPPKLSMTIPIENYSTPQNFTIQTANNSISTIIYPFHKAIEANNITIEIDGSVSTISTAISIVIYKLPYYNYKATIQLIFPNTTIITKPANATYFWGQLYIEAAFPIHLSEQVRIHHFPKGTIMKVIINPLNLTVKVPIK
ncbi:MAG: hypothetical protein F7B60_01710 [Desulfurococcales archaeon]|nr:hypothetical protein [Desulfurococcales archaeon]